MARRRRSDLPDGAFHVIAHAVADEPLFFDSCDRKRYLGLLQQAVETYRWKVLTFVLLDNHVHLLVVAEARDLSAALWSVHSNYARHFHRRHPPRRGHVFESRPKTLPIGSESYLLAVLRYIANNPVAAGVCSHPDGYPWSAHRAILGISPPMPVVAEDEVLMRFGSDLPTARSRYEAFVAGEDPPGHDEVRRWSEGPPPDRPPLAEILASGDPVAAARVAHVRWHYSMRAIASAIGVTPATVSKWIKRPR
jgi:putative transposase